MHLTGMKSMTGIENNKNSIFYKQIYLLCELVCYAILSCQWRSKEGYYAEI